MLTPYFNVYSQPITDNWLLPQGLTVRWCAPVSDAQYALPREITVVTIAFPQAPFAQLRRRKPKLAFLGRQELVEILSKRFLLQPCEGTPLVFPVQRGLSATGRVPLRSTLFWSNMQAPKRDMVFFNFGLICKLRIFSRPFYAATVVNWSFHSLNNTSARSRERLWSEWEGAIFIDTVTLPSL